MQTEPRARFYHPELDGLRFIAFLLVFIHNSLPVLEDTFLETVSKYGWIGVDLFFCLSAFLITKLLVTEYRQSGKINIRNFYIRRILRIWPLYFFYTIIAIIIMAPISGRNINIPGHIAGLVTFTFNIVYFTLLPSPILILIHLWSISFEEQFYVAVPWALRKLLSVSNNVKWILLTVTFILGNTVRAVFIYLKVDHPVIYFLPITHFDSILAGLVLGLGLLDKSLANIRGYIVFLIGFLLNSLIFMLPNNDVTGWGLMLTYPLTALGMTLIVASAVNKKHPIVEMVLGNKLLVRLGRVSYGLYIYHFGSLTLATLICNTFLGITIEQIAIFRILAITIGFILTIFFSALSYHLLEKPFLKLKERFSQVPSGFA